MVDIVVPRGELPATIGRLLSLLRNRKGPETADLLAIPGPKQTSAASLDAD